MRYLLLLIAFGITPFLSAQTGIVQGKATSTATGELLPYVRIILMQNDSIKYFCEADSSGVYKIPGIKPGTYNLKCTCMGYQEKIITGIPVKGNYINFVDIKLNDLTCEPCPLEIKKKKKRNKKSRQ